MQNLKYAFAYSPQVGLLLIDLTAAMPSTNHAALDKGVCTSAKDSSIRKFRNAALQPCLRSLSGDAKASGQL